jgi:NADPH:quinone reductase-like Zn-dependent oxidoreductase
MKAIVCRRYGSPEALTVEEMPVPQPGDGEVLVRVHAASINDFDVGLLRGSPLLVRFFNGLRTPRVRVLGCDMAGRIEGVGPSVTRFAPGDEVLADLSEHGFGAFAEYVRVPEAALVAKPAAISFEEAAALPQAGVLALQGLFGVEPVRAGQQVLLNGAGGGVGTLGVQLAKRRGAEVTCVDSAGKLPLLASLGADHVIDYRETDFTRTGARYDLIVDTRTSRSPFAHARALARGGHYVTVGGSMPRIAEQLAFAPIIARTSRRHLHMVALKANWQLGCLAELAAAGEIRPVIDARSFPLTEVPEALRLFETATHQGKVIVRMF